MNLFKGYIKTKEKRPLEKFKGRTDFATLAEVENEPEYAGIIADDVVLIDIDNAEMAEKMMDIVEGEQLDCVVHKTTRGKHFYFAKGDFEKCGTHKRLACGLEADIKIGPNAYAIVKYAGKTRFCEWDCETLQPAPKWLLPVKRSADFLDMEPGEGRNQALFNYILALTSNGFSKDETRECLRIINKYVLSEPLSDDELATLSRDEAFPEDIFYDGKRFMQERFGQFLVSNYGVKRINGQLHIWRNGNYVSGYRFIENAMLEYSPTIRATQRAEVLKYLEAYLAEDTPSAPANLIAFGNGVLDISSMKMRDMTADDVIVNRIPWDYDPQAYSEIADKTLNKLSCGDAEIRALLEECIGYCFYRRNELSKAFMLTGERSNGKSTFLDMVKNVLGEQNYSALDINEMEERFSVETMAGKLANVGDDISDEFLSGRIVSVFKKVVSGNKVKAEKKGQDAFFFEPYLKLLFSANDVPRIRDKTGAVLRRLVIVPFNAKFSKDDPDWNPYIRYELQAPEVMKYLVRIGIEGLRRVLENRSFSKSAKVEREIAEYEISNNPVLLFLQEHEGEILHQPTRIVHKRYDVFCAENGFSTSSLITFTKAVNKKLGYTTRRVRVAGKLESVFERSADDE